MAREIGRRRARRVSGDAPTASNATYSHGGLPDYDTTRSLPTLTPGEQGDGATVYAVAETAAGHIAYDPVAVAIGEEWPIAPPPAVLSPWEPLSDRAAAALMERAGAALTAPDEA